MVGVVVVYLFAVAAVLLGWLYLGRYRMARPALGVFNLSDVAVMAGGIVVLPYLYLLLPLALVAVVFGLALLNVLALAAEPVLGARRVIWLAALGIGAVEVGLLLRAGAMSPPLLAVNDLVLALAVVGIANLWVQSGMRARDAAILGGVLAAYDLVATAVLPLTADLVGRLTAIPFAPVVAWPAGAAGQWVGLGLGDLIFATTFPLVLRKAFGTSAGVVGLLASLTVLGALLALAAAGLLPGTFPVMVVLGPLFVAQERFWRRRLGRERTTPEYRAYERELA